jgi:glycosyltransferase involved in cell wall biosynthesis
MISVCMATFNGNKYITLQLESILMQLNEGDEIVIVDDASTDETVQLIKNIQDSRIKLFENMQNMGVIPSFSRSIYLARGEVIFLSDQDDIWLPNKVKEVMNIFAKKMDTTLCLSDAKIIDGTGSIRKNTYFQIRGKFTPSLFQNIIKNRFLGCSISFKSSMKEHILPFPKNIPAHDMWIGIMNLIYGKVAYIDKPLFLYRRHTENVTSMSHAKIHTVLKWRLALVYRLLQNTFKRIFQIKK